MLMNKIYLLCIPMLRFIVFDRFFYIGLTINLQALNIHVLYYTRWNIGTFLITFHGACLLLIYTLIASPSYWFTNLVKASY